MSYFASAVVNVCIDVALHFAFCSRCFCMSSFCSKGDWVMENLCKGKNEGISGEREYDCIHTHSLKHTLSFAHSQEQHKVILFCVRERLYMCLHSCMHSLCVFSSFEENKTSTGTFDKLRYPFEYILCIIYFSPSVIRCLALSALNILSSTHATCKINLLSIHFKHSSESNIVK